MPKPRISVVDFFSGCGGTSCGFEQAGLRIAMGLDHDDDAGRTFRRNLPNASFELVDIEKIQPVNLFAESGRPPGYLLFSGCAPCQPFTKQRTTRRGSKDGRRNLLLTFGRMVEHWLPDLVFVENVPGLSSAPSRSGPFARFVSLLRRRGYWLEFGAVAARDYGVPQKRERLVLMASRLGPVRLPDATHGLNTANPCFSTVRDWIATLPALAAGEVCPRDPDHHAAALEETNLERIRSTPEGGGRDSWPAHLLLNCHRAHSGHTDVYGRLWWDRPASALTTRCISYSNGRFGHPEQDRALSLREAACLQTFPRSWRFCGSLGSKARQVGNAVPPLMARAVGQAFMDHVAMLSKRQAA